MYPVDVRYRPLRTARRGGRRRGGARGRDRRRGRGPVAQRPGRHPRVPARASARSARPRTCCARGLARRPYAARGRDPAALRAALGAGAAARVRAVVGTAHRARDQRRGDLAHRARHPLRDRQRASRASSATRCATRRRCCRSRRSRRRRRTSAPGAAGASPTASACASTARTTSRRGPQYTEPEILRSSLAAVILRMAALALGDVEAFPFVEPPGPRAIADGYQLLQELGAVDAERRLTPLGRELARLPVDPRIGRMVARRARARLPRRSAGHRERAVGARSARAAAREAAGGRPGAPRLPRRALGLPVAARALGVLRREARREALAPQARRCLPRAVRLVPAPRANGATCTRSSRARSPSRAGRGRRSCPAAIDAARYQAIHQALLAGLLGNIGTQDGDGDGYLGARGIRFHLHPGSGLAKKRPKWVLAAELVETSRLFARCAAKIEPEWIEAVAGDRVTRDYFEPRWDAERGEVVASERVQLYGLTLVPRRRVSYGNIDPEAARDVFIREALVPGDARDEGRVPRAQPEARRRGGGARAQGAAPGRAGRRRGDRRVLRRARARRRAFARDLRALARRTPSAAIRARCTSRARR